MKNITSGGIIRHARMYLGMTQMEFGIWLAKKTGRAIPVPKSRISEWENGIKSPRLNVRLVCRNLAANAALDKIKIANVLGEMTDDKAIKIIVECQS